MAKHTTEGVYLCFDLFAVSGLGCGYSFKKKKVLVNFVHIKMDIVQDEDRHSPPLPMCDVCSVCGPSGQRLISSDISHAGCYCMKEWGGRVMLFDIRRCFSSAWEAFWEQVS